MSTVEHRVPANRNGRRCAAIGPAELRHPRCMLPAGANGHTKLNAANHGRLGLPVLLHRSENAEHWTIHGVVDLCRSMANDES